MNDFTIEELQLIKKALGIIESDYSHLGCSMPYSRLAEKIQSMINNYSHDDQELAEIKREIESLYE